MGGGQLGIPSRFLRRKIEKQESIGTGGGRILLELLESVDVDRIKVSEENDGDLACFSNLTDKFKDSGDRRAGGKRAPGSCLNGGTISQRIGKRDSQFQEIDPGFFHGEGDLGRGCKAGITTGDVGDHSWAPT